ELLQRVGDERAQRIFQAHHRLLKDTAAAHGGQEGKWLGGGGVAGVAPAAPRALKDTAAAHGGQEVKWLGDGLMTVFASAADAVRAAVAMQQAARRRAAGERLGARGGADAARGRPAEA